MRILVLAPTLYSRGAASGGAAVCRGLLERLATRHSLTLVAFTSGRARDEIADDLAEMRDWIEDVRVVALDRGRWANYLAKAAVLGGVPSAAAFYHRSAFVAAIRASVSAFPPDVAMAQFPEMAQYVGAVGVPAVMDVQDAYSVSKYRRALNVRGPVKRVWDHAQWLSWVHYERRYYRRFQRVLTLTDQDNYGLKVFSPTLPVVTTGVAFDPPRLSVDEVAPPEVVGFAGSFSHMPNIDAIAYFAETILPRLRERRSDARFVVAGRNPPDELVRRYEGRVEFVGFVPDIYAFFRSCGVVVVPLLWGGGIKIKTVQALLAGAPVVSTSVGVEGTGAVDRKHVLVEDDPERFAATLAHVMSSAELRSELGKAAQSFAELEFTWAGKLELIEQVLDAARKSKNSHHSPGE